MNTYKLHDFRLITFFNLTGFDNSYYKDFHKKKNLMTRYDTSWYIRHNVYFDSNKTCLFLGSYMYLYVSNSIPKPSSDLRRKDNIRFLVDRHWNVFFQKNFPFKVTSVKTRTKNFRNHLQFVS